MIASKRRKPLALITSRSMPTSMSAPAWNELDVLDADDGLPVFCPACDEREFGRES